jgi:dihydrofolate synthase / folylpolyglutamate synthase
VTFADAETYLYGLIDYERTPAHAAMARYLNLARMTELLARAGTPQRGLRCAHLAGTKGKGSTAALLASILRAAGQRTGLYTSPHLITFRERITVDGVPIPEEAFAALIAATQPHVEAMRDAPGGPPSFFEVLTALAFLWFRAQAVDVAVLETGLGGRLDATNVVYPLVTGITTLALDHQQELGDTLAAIAGEKAGILKPGVPVVSAPQHPEAEAVLAAVATARHCPRVRVGHEVTISAGPFDDCGQRCTIRGRLGEYTDLRLPLLGAHQLTNAAVAVGMAECLAEAGEPVTPAAIRTGVAEVAWPGRLQVLQRAPTLILDGAHDPASTHALLAALARHFPGRPLHVVAGFSREKDWPVMVPVLAAAAASLTFVAAASPRAVAPADAVAALGTAARGTGVSPVIAADIPTGIAAALSRAATGDLVIVTGSLYVVGEALAWWHGAG